MHSSGGAGRRLVHFSSRRVPHAGTPRRGGAERPRGQTTRRDGDAPSAWTAVVVHCCVNAVGVLAAASATAHANRARGR